MMAEPIELDLDAKTEEGVTGKAADDGAEAKPKRGRKPGGRPPRSETELESRLMRIIGRLADRREERDDLELADALREDGKAMADGVVNGTRQLPQFRIPVLLLLGIVEPLLAFGRVGGILLRRLQDRRLTQAEEAAAAAAASQDVEFMAGVPVDELGNPIV
jgi:hypothetical protein